MSHQSTGTSIPRSEIPISLFAIEDLGAPGSRRLDILNSGAAPGLEVARIVGPGVAYEGLQDQAEVGDVNNVVWRMAISQAM